MAIIVKLDDLLHARRMTLTELSARLEAGIAAITALSNPA